MKDEWNNTDRILFGIVYGTMAAGMAIWGIAQLIEACRSRPKVQVYAFGVKSPAKVEIQGPDESPSAADNQ